MTPKQVRKAWAKALRSGKYVQGKEWLHTEGEDGVNRFCCLGVLCELAVEKGVIPPGEKERDDYSHKSYMGAEGELPKEVRAWAGLQYDHGGFKYKNGVSTSLVNLNDAKGYDFNQIADVIEEEPKGLVKEKE